MDFKVCYFQNPLIKSSICTINDKLENITDKIDENIFFNMGKYVKYQNNIIFN